MLGMIGGFMAFIIVAVVILVIHPVSALFLRHRPW